jgi:hypothetical protein
MFPPEFTDNSTGGSRLRSLARALHARLYVSTAGQIFAVRGRPDHAALARCLGKFSAAPTAAEAPTPVELGIEVANGELTPSTLTSIGQALVLWRQKLSARPPIKRARRRDEAIADQSQEIAVLAGRLAACRQWSELAAGGGEPAGAPYLLGESAEANLRQALDASQMRGPWHDWLARLVLWLAGPRALTRFLAAAAALAAQPPPPERTGGLLAAIAVTVSCDGGAALLPARLLQAGPNFAAVALTQLVALRNYPAYDRLLVALNELPNLLPPRLFASVRALLERGIGLADIVWASERHLLTFLADAKLPLAKVRQAECDFASRGLPLGGTDLMILVDVLYRQSQQTLPARWLQWADRWPALSLPPRLRKVLQVAFADCVLPALRRPWQTACVEQWLAVAIPKTPAPLSADPQTCLEQLAAYQRMLGKQPAVPKSARQLMERGHGNASRKLARATNSATVVAAVDALRSLLRSGGETAWRQTATIAPPTQSRVTAIHLAGWLADMTDAERQWLRQVTAAWQAVGLGYKASLEANRDWLAQAAAAGIDLAPWLHCETVNVEIGGQPVEIGLAADPRDVFLMGDYFRTCLSLGGMYQMSPLANAYDANKQVVLAVGHTSRGKRQVLARQLIAISPQWQLIGYRCYRAYCAKQPAEREACLAAMAAWCGRLARRCGLLLGSEGEPAALTVQNWHDDGVIPWHSAAQAAWQAASPSPSSLQPHVWLCLPGSLPIAAGSEVPSTIA